MGDDLHDFVVEARFEAAPAVLAAVLGQVGLAVGAREGHWTLSGLPWWYWLVPVVPEAILFVALAWNVSSRRLHAMGRRRLAVMALVGLITTVNSIALGGLVVSIVGGHESSGAELLVKGGVIWATNVIAFGLWYWELDCGGPVRRHEPDPPWPDFQFPQMENPQLAPPAWRPHLLDYVYIAFTNAIAFSPTDAMPLTARAKTLMLLESAASALTVLLVAARAVNILH